MACSSEARERWESRVCTVSLIKVEFQFLSVGSPPRVIILKMLWSRIIFPSFCLPVEFCTFVEAVYHSLGKIVLQIPQIKHGFFGGHHLLRPWSVQGHHYCSSVDGHATPDGRRAISFSKTAEGFPCSRRLRAFDCNDSHPRALHARSCL